MKWEVEVEVGGGEWGSGSSLSRRVDVCRFQPLSGLLL